MKIDEDTVWFMQKVLHYKSKFLTYLYLLFITTKAIRDETYKVMHRFHAAEVEEMGCMLRSSIAS